MQISEELVKQITNAVLSQMSQSGVSSSTGDHITAPSSGKSLSLAGRERINDEKTSYASYPRAKKGTDPKEVVIGVGAAFQKEIKKTICGIPLDDVLRNVKAGIEEEGMIPRVVKILDTSDWKQPSCPVPVSVSASSPKGQPLFIRKTFSRSPIWSCSRRRRL